MFLSRNKKSVDTLYFWLKKVTCQEIWLCIAELFLIFLLLIIFQDTKEKAPKQNATCSPSSTAKENGGIDFVFYMPSGCQNDQ